MNKTLVAFWIIYLSSVCGLLSYAIYRHGEEVEAHCQSIKMDFQWGVGGVPECVKKENRK